MIKFIKSLFFVCFAALSASCVKSPHSRELEQALRFAGDNRTELETVLAFYSFNPADSLKYRAAVFLIENMPYYFTFKNDLLSLYQEKLYSTAVEQSCWGDEAVMILAQRYGHLNPQEFERVHDIHIITADYLVRNIEQAFRVWQTKPWAQYVSFDDFCEQILPYRIKDEPLTNWREAYYNRFQPILDSLQIDTNSPIEVINALWSYIQSTENVHWEAKLPAFPFPDALSLLNDRYLGDCYEFAHRSVYIMRALGIPVGIGGYLQHPYGLGAHIWNFVPDSCGTMWEFSLNGYPPRPAKSEKPTMGRVYHHTFVLQKESLPMLMQGKRDFPHLLRNPFIKDASEYYLHDVSIHIPVSREQLKDTILYLCTFSSRGWTPVAWSLWNREKEAFVFDFVEKSILYLPAYYIDGEIFAAINPGSVNDEGIYVQVPLDMEKRQTLVLERKYPFRPQWERQRRRILGGKFQIANNPDFRNAVTLHTINEEADMKWHNIDVQRNSAYQYIRFLSGENGHNNMAEIQVFDSTGRRISGRIIGIEGSHLNQKDNCREAVFDNDPLTFFDAIERAGAWAGLDFGIPRQIGKISYLFRNDDNSIRIGDVYELFYWNKTRWQSLGRQTAMTDNLVFDNCPADAFFWLRNHTRGREELPFFYRNDEQIFWQQ
jgi:hypothetical protein